MPPKQLNLVLPKEAYPSRALLAALKACGDYVYGYYGEPSNPAAPFYVGKGSGNRVLQHWINATSSRSDKELKKQELVIREILAAGQLPVVKLLAYNVETTKGEDVYSLVERVIQDAFGIQRVWEKNPGLNDREVELPVSSLVQIRSDSSPTPVLSLEALIGLKAERSRVEKRELATMADAPVLLVGLSKTYHPSFSAGQLAEMARMYWDLEKRFGNTSFPTLNTHPHPVLLAWHSVNKIPTIVGAWRIQKGTKGAFATYGNSGRQICNVMGPDLELRKTFLGLRLSGSGTKYQGPQIIIPPDLSPSARIFA